MNTTCANWSPLGSGSSFRAALSLRETVLLASVTEKAVRKDIEDHVLRPMRLEHDDAKLHFRWADVFLFAAVYRNRFMSRDMRKLALDRLEDCVAPSYRRDSSELLTNHIVPTALFDVTNILIECTPLRLDNYVMIDVCSVKNDIGPRVSLYARGLSKIDENPTILGGEPVFKNTRLPVRHVGKMANNGEAIEDILADYPYLDIDGIEFAKLYAEANPARGRPPTTRGTRVETTSA